MKKLFFPLIAVLALASSALASCPPLIRTINLTGVDNRLRADVSDAVQPFKLREPSEETIQELIAAIRRVYQANCLLDRLEAVRVRVKADKVFVKVYQNRF